MEELGMINLNDGGKMPKVAFGTGTTFTNRTDDVFDGILKAFNAGYRLFDTAMVYGTETGVGKAVRKLLDEGLCKREDVFITTKIPPIFGKFEDVVDAVNNCLTKLQLDYIDLILIHAPGFPPNYVLKTLGQEMAEKQAAIKDMSEARIVIWEALQFCQKEGKVKHIGVSNYNRDHIEQMLTNPRCNVVPAVNQIEFNPYIVDNDILDVCKTNKIVVQAYAPIGTGTGVRVREKSNASNNERALDDPVIQKIAQRIGCTGAQVCIGYALAKDVVVVTKTEKAERMKENLDSIKIAKMLTNDDITEIDKLNKNQRNFVDVYSIK